MTFFKSSKIGIQEILVLYEWGISSDLLINPIEAFRFKRSLLISYTLAKTVIITNRFKI